MPKGIDKHCDCCQCNACKNDHGIWSFGSLGVLLNISAMVPQLIQVYKTRSTVSFSMTWIVIAFFANLFLFIYGINYKSAPNYISAGFFMLVYIYLYCMKRKYNGM